MSMSRLGEKKPFFTKKRLLRAALILCICVMVAALAYIVYYLTQYFGQRQLENDIRNIFHNVSPAPVAEPSPSPELPVAGEPTPYQPQPSPPNKYEVLLATEKENIELYKDLLEINPHYRGMFSIPGLIDELPYVLGEDNDFYLNHDFYGKYNLNGTIFLNVDNNRLLTDRNNSLFGHNMNTGAMFAKLHQYEKAETYKTAPIVELDSLTGKTTWIVFAAYHTEPDWGYIQPHPPLEQYGALLEEIKARSIFLTDVEVDETDQILTLSTCSYTGQLQNMRFAVHARLLRPDEEIPEEVLATENPDQLSYNIPQEIARSEVEWAAPAIMQHPRSLKTYYYQIGDGVINWYSSKGGDTLQGPYTNFHGKVKPGSLLTAAYHPGEEKMYYALDHYNGNQGIFLLTSNFPHSGSIRFASDSAVTPSGADAVSPMLSYTGDTMWLLYTVKKSDSEEIYRAALTKSKLGEPELVVTLPLNTGARAIGQVAYNGGIVVFWHEKGPKTVKGTWLGSGETFTPQFNGSNDRLTLYGTVSDGKIKVMAEKDGVLTPSTFDLGSIPPAPVVVPASPDIPPADIAPSPADISPPVDPPSDVTPPPENPPVEETPPVPSPTPEEPAVP